MTVERKILLGYGVAFALMGVVFAWAVVNLVTLGQASDAILRENYRSILAAENMVDALERQDSAVLLTVFSDRERGIAQFEVNEAEFLQWLARAKDNVTVEGEAELLRQIETDYAEYRRVFTGIARHAGGDTAGLYDERAYPLFMKVREACVGLRTLNEGAMYDASTRAGEVANRAVWSTVVVAALAFLAALGFNLMLAERIARPLRHLADASRRVADGDYSVRVAVESADEVGVLAGEFNQMTAKLEEYRRMDIDAVVAQKQKGEAILASIEDGIVVFGADLVVTDLNPAARRMLDVDIVDGRARTCADVLPDRRVCALVEQTVASAAPPEVDEEERYVKITRDGETRWYLFSFTTIPMAEGGPAGVVLLLRDVTRLKEVERLKSEFVMAASHELRNPLTGMGMSLDLLRERVVPSLEPRDRELLDAAHEELQRLKALVDDLLDLSKIEAGRIELEFESVPPSLVFDRAREVFESQLREKAVELDGRALLGLPPMWVDPTKITWVLTNLISNALRYVPTGGHIWVSGKLVGRHVQLTVRDDGPGIAPEHQSRIFKKFVQVNGRETAGTGLGLAICREIVRAHGGTIWVESALGRGSSFSFSVPAVGEEE